MGLFDGEGDVYLIERSLKKGALKQIVTEDFLRHHIWKHEFAPGLRTTSRPECSAPAEEDLVEEYLTLIVSIRKVDEYVGSLLPLPMSENVFCQLSQQLHVPDIYLPILQRQTSLHTKANSRIHSQEASLGDDISFVVHSNMNTRFWYAASFSYNIKTRRMFAFIHCILTLSVEDFLARIESDSSGALTTFWMIPSILSEFALDLWQDLEHQHYETIYELEKATGVIDDSEKPADLETTDLTKLTRDVNWVITNLGFLSYDFDTLRPMLHFVDDAVRLYREKTAALDPPNTRASKVERAVLEKNAYLYAWIDGMDKRCTYLLGRGQAQVQTIYSLIAQKDNVLSRKLTEASIKQTEASQQLAKTSTDLAMMTSRDSTVMRTIAAVTIFFLPATFTATFFSTTFFDFHGDQSSNVVSWWLWLYFVITVALTGAVLGGWYYYAKRKEAELLKAFGASKSGDQ